MRSIKSQFSNQVDWHNLLSSGNRLFIGSNVAVPNALIDSLIKDGEGLDDLELTHIGTISDNKWALPEYQSRFKVNTFFIHGKEVRQAVDEGRADYTPCFLSEISSLFVNDTLPLDAALIMVSPPDELGYCSLGVSVDVVMSAARAAKHIIAQINPADERRLQEFFYSHTKETIRMRYNYNPGPMTRQKSCDLVSVDQSKDIALTIVRQEGSKTRIEAVGRYYLYEQANACEVAFVTRENNQGKGMAKRLLQEMISIAKLRHLEKVFALVKTSNKAMITVFEQFGFMRTPSDEIGEIELVFDLANAKLSDTRTP